MNRLQEAFRLAAETHFDHFRKGTHVPYLTHLLAVSALVGEFGGDEDLIIAALLHDTLEDHPERVTLEMLIEKFGWRVGHVVVGCSDTLSKPKPPWEQRKRLFLERLETADAGVRLVVAADKLHNAQTLVRDIRVLGDGMWDRFNATKDRQFWYLRACMRVLGTGWNNPILGELERIHRALEEVCGMTGEREWLVE